MYGFIFTKSIIGILHNFFRTISVHPNINYFIISHLGLSNIPKSYSHKITSCEVILGRKVLPTNQINPKWIKKKLGEKYVRW